MEARVERLEGKRSELIERLSKMEPFRRGTISVNYTKCGKDNCACAKEGHEGHMRYLWSATIKGKSRSKNIRLGLEMAKYHGETKGYKEFVKLCSKLVEVNEEICDLRPVEAIEDADELMQLKKKLQRIYKGKLRKK
mgnify:CR=1 FL=1|jgi:hypothetical protein